MAGRWLAVLATIATVTALLGAEQSPAAGPAPLGPPFAVADVEYPSYARPAVGADATGGFVVVWGDDYEDELRGRRYDAGGDALGPAFAIASAEAGEYFEVGEADVAMNGDGAFVVVWEQNQYGPGGLDGIAARRFDAAGVPLGSAFLVANDPEDGSLDGPEVATSDAGGFVVVWEQSEYGPGGLDGIAARRFDAEGAPLGSAFLVAEDPEDGQLDRAEVAMSAAGAFVVAWEQEDYGAGGLDGIAARRFDAAGAPLGSAFLVASDPEDGYLEPPDVAMDAAGAFVVVWQQEDYGPGGLDGIVGRRYQASGLADGGPFLVVEDQSDDESDDPSVAAHADGFAVAWASESYTDPERQDKILARRFETPEPMVLAQGLAAWLALGLLAARTRRLAR